MPYKQSGFSSGFFVEKETNSDTAALEGQASHKAREVSGDLRNRHLSQSIKNEKDRV